MPEAVALVLVLALALPYALPLSRVSPVAAGVVWLAALALRALVALGLALAALLLLPASALFARVSDWSAHGIVGSFHLELSGEPIAHLAAVGPPALLALSLLVFIFTVARGAAMLRRELSRRALGRGPSESLVFADRSLVVAVPGVGPGRIVLSDRALAELDQAELEGCLAHERAHLRRRHRALGLIAGCLVAVARPLPGSRSAERGLRLSLERDADEHAVARTGDPLALASAICKVAGAAGRLPAGQLALALHGSGATRARLDGLMAGGRRRGSAALECAVLLAGGTLSLLAASSAGALAVWLATTAPAAALAAALACGG